MKPPHRNGWSTTPKLRLTKPDQYGAMGGRHRKDFGKPLAAKEGGQTIACPLCNDTRCRVLDSRYQSHSNACRRRRQCTACNYRFTTYEMVAIENVPDYQI